MVSDAPYNVGGLPSDIVERIASLIDDYSTLLSFTQLCKRAYFLTRGLAFRAVHIHHRNSTEFLELMEHPFSSIPSSVTQLSIRGNNISDITRDIISSRRNPEQPSWINTAIRQLALLTRVKQLSIKDVMWELVNQETRDTLITIFKEIDVLEMDGILFAGYEDLMTHLCAFPNLREVHLVDIVWLNRDGNESDDWSDSDEEVENEEETALEAGGTVLHEIQKWTPKFPSLNVLAAAPPTIWDLLMRMDVDDDDGRPAPPSSLSVKALVSPMLFDSAFTPLNNVLKIIGPSLEHLALNLRCIEGPLSSPPSLENLSLNTNLRTMFLVLPRCHTDHSLDWLLPLLSQVSSNKLIVITLWFQQHLDSTSYFPWAELDELLTTHANFQNLERLALEAPGTSRWDIMSSKLKGCYDRKLVSVKRVNESFYRTSTRHVDALDFYRLPTLGLNRDWLNFE